MVKPGRRGFEAASGDAARPEGSLEASAALQTGQLVAEARAAGYREGEAAGRQAAAADFQPKFERLARSLEDLAGFRARLRREAEAEMLQLSLAIARRVLHRELALDPEALHGLVLAALEKLEAKEITRVRVHPGFEPQVRALLASLPAGAGIVVAPDPAREPGTVIFETERGDLDASVESQLREIERGLTDRLERKS
jgi:flagellar assembly protein FliH